MKLKSCVALGAFALATTLSACGGGGGSSSPTPPSPSAPAVNTPPNADISTTNAVTDERQEISLSAAGSSDADGDSLTYSWSQIAGPDLGAGTQTGDTFTAQVPKLTADETYTIELTASDGQASTTQTIEIIGRKIVLSPLSDKWGNLINNVNVEGELLDAQIVLESRPLPLGYIFVLRSTQIRENSTSGVEEVVFAKSYADYVYQQTPSYQFHSEETYTISGLSNDPDQIIFRENVDQMGGDDVISASERDGNIKIFRSQADDPEAFDLTGDFDIDGICFVKSYFGPVDGISPVPGRSTVPNIIVGTRDGRLLALVNEGNPAPTSFTITPEQIDLRGRYNRYIELASSGNFCDGFMGTTSIQEGAQYFAGFDFFDPTSSSIVTYLLDASGSNLAEYQTKPLGLPAGETYSLINTDNLGLYQNNAEAESFSAFLMTSGRHHGPHFVLLKRADGEIDSIQLPNGVPTDLILMDTGTHELPDNQYISELDSDIMVISKDSPYAVFYENLSEVEPFGTFAPVEYLDIGFGNEKIMFIGEGTPRLNDIAFYAADAEQFQIIDGSPSVPSFP